MKLTDLSHLAGERQATPKAAATTKTTVKTPATKSGTAGSGGGGCACGG